MYRKKYGLLSTDNQGKPVGRSTKGPSGSHKNHSALSGEPYIDVLNRGSHHALWLMKPRPQNRFTERNMVFQVVTTRVNQLAILSRVPMGVTQTTQHCLGSSLLMFKVLWLRYEYCYRCIKRRVTTLNFSNRAHWLMLAESAKTNSRLLNPAKILHQLVERDFQ